jgi:hypothetical protein
MYGPVSFAIEFVDQAKHFTGGEVRVNFAIRAQRFAQQKFRSGNVVGYCTRCVPPGFC